MPRPGHRVQDGDAAGLKHMRLVANLEAEPRHLLDDQDSEAARPQLPHKGEGKR